MKKMSITLFKPGGWLSIFGKSVFLVLFTCLAYGLQGQDIPLTTSNDVSGNTFLCDHSGQTLGAGRYTDDGGDPGNYNDNPDTRSNGGNPLVWTFCPDDPKTDKIQIEFEDLDIHSGDLLYFFPGRYCTLLDTRECGPSTQFSFTAPGGNPITALGVGSLDALGNLVWGASDPSLMAFGVPNLAAPVPPVVTSLGYQGLDFGAGWIRADASAMGGCISMVWAPNNDNNKGDGWEILVSEIPAVDAGGDLTGIDCVDDLNDRDHTTNRTILPDLPVANCGTNAIFNIPAPDFDGCSTGSGYSVQVLVDGVNQGRIDANVLFGYDPTVDPLLFNTLNLGVGNHWVEYRLLYDYDCDNNNNNSDAIECDVATCNFSVYSFDNLVCNDNLNIALGNDCVLFLTPDDILERINAYVPVMSNIAGGASYEISVPGSANGNGTDQVRIEGSGEYTYTITDVCGNTCRGTFTALDVEGPLCQNPANQVHIDCMDALPTDTNAKFSDCSGDYIEPTYTDEMSGDCLGHVLNGTFGGDGPDGFVDLINNASSITAGATATCRANAALVAGLGIGDAGVAPAALGVAGMAIFDNAATAGIGAAAAAQAALIGACGTDAVVARQAACDVITAAMLASANAATANASVIAAVQVGADAICTVLQGLPAPASVENVVLGPDGVDDCIDFPTLDILDNAATEIQTVANGVFTPVFITGGDMIPDCNIDVNFIGTVTYNVPPGVPQPNVDPIGTGRGLTLDKVTTRNYKALDVHGNEGACTHYIYHWKPVMFNPPSGTPQAGRSISLTCDTDIAPEAIINSLSFTNFDRTFVPWYTDVNFGLRSVPSGSHTCGFAVTHNDVSEIPTCGTGRKVIREWTVIDWCGSGLAVSSAQWGQVIELTDFAQPVLTDAPVTMPLDVTIDFGRDSFDIDTIYLDAHSCTSSDLVPGADFTDECSPEGLSYFTEIRGPVRDRDGDWDVDLNDADLAPVLWTGNQNGGSFGDLAPGNYWIVITAVDDCGNTTTRTRSSFRTSDWAFTPRNVHYAQLHVVDNVLPQPQCDDQINVSLGNDWGRVDAADVDEGSYDNCGVETIQVAIGADGAEPAADAYADFVDVTCNDIHETLKVYLRVSDAQGNSNVCWSNIVIEDKLRPVCTPPVDMTISCDDLPHANTFASGIVDNDSEMAAELVARFGDVDCVDNLTCGDLTFVQSLDVDATSCGRYTITRTWTASDWNEKNTSQPVSQTITVEYTPGWRLDLPGDMDIECLIGEDQPDFSISEGDITVHGGSCDQIGIEVESREFVAQDGACKKLEVTYHIINWCIYNPGDAPVVIARAEEDGVAIPFTIGSDSHGDDSYLTYTIVKKLVDNVAPEILDLIEPDSCITTGTSDNGCSEAKTWRAWANDCVGDDEMTWDAKVYEVDADGNRTEVLSTGARDGGYWAVTANVSNKSYYVAEFWASDGCGNSGGRSTDPVQFWDCKKPTPYALNGVAISLMPTGMVQIWASDIDRNSEDNCGEVDLYIRATKSKDAPASVAEVRALGTSATFTCLDLGNNIVELYAVDAEDNWDFVSTYVLIQDNMGACSNVEPAEVSQVAGTVLNADGEYVEDVAVSVNGNMASMSTTNNGQYTFTLPTGEDYTITPEKNVNPLNGVSTFDLVLISKHILGITPFDTPYKYIAADVNKSGSVTAFDMVQLRQLILNITTEFPNNTSWRFVDAAHNFGAAPLTENFNEFISINDFDSNMTDVNFIAVKTGDVNGNAQPNSLVASDVRTAGTTLTLTSADQFVEAGQEVTVAFTADMAGVSGYQFTMEHAGLTFTQLGEGVATAENFNTNLRGAVATSWNGTATANDVLFTLNFKATTAGNLSELLSLSSDVVAAEAYTATGEVMDVAINFTTSEAATFGLEQNTPNPFNGETVIGFTLPQAGQATLKVMDVQGKVLQSFTNDYAKGYNQVSISAKQLGATGVLHYQLESADNVATKKMIIIE